MNDFFDVPVVLFLFKRKDAALRVLERIAAVRPFRLYLLADQGRDDAERELVRAVREAVDAYVAANFAYGCEIIRDYAKENRGVYRNIGEGALRVFDKEKRAIFLEDDNLPEVSFFKYCKEMLEKYEDEERVLWVCGTNYLGDGGESGSYAFTRHMLPCGWASWGHKFTKYYDGEFSLLRRDSNTLKNLRKNFETGRLYKMVADRWRAELALVQRGEQPSSWDYQMYLTLRYYNLLGVAPMVNQIRNIGVDAFSAHGGVSMDNIMTRRYCGMDSYPLKFPLRGPDVVAPDAALEKKLERIIVYPWWLRVRIRIGQVMRFAKIKGE